MDKVLDFAGKVTMLMLLVFCTLLMGIACVAAICGTYNIIFLGT